jgi:hypothetical protein
MRTNVSIDDGLDDGLIAQKAVIEETLRTLARLKPQEQMRSLRGCLHWEGDLPALREGRLAYPVNQSR